MTKVHSEKQVTAYYRDGLAMKLRKLSAAESKWLADQKKRAEAYWSGRRKMKEAEFQKQYREASADARQWQATYEARVAFADEMEKHAANPDDDMAEGESHQAGSIAGDAFKRMCRACNAVENLEELAKERGFKLPITSPRLGVSDDR